MKEFLDEIYQVLVPSNPELMVFAFKMHSMYLLCNALGYLITGNILIGCLDVLLLAIIRFVMIPVAKSYT